MDVNYNNILIFATNIKTKADKEFVSDILSQDTVIQCWSVDLEDIDCVLRIESKILTAIDIIKIINILGFKCKELE